MGILWRLFAPRGLKRARRAMHPSWVIEDAIVRSARGNRKRRKAYLHPGCTINHGSPETRDRCRKGYY